MKAAHRLALADAAEGARDPRRRTRARGRGMTDARAGVIDLFAGIGCVADGFAQTGRFEPLALIDQDPDAQAAYLHNRPGAPYRLGDVAALTAGDFDEIRAGRTIAGVLGCPPCQGFSAAGRRRADDQRNRLLAGFFSAVALADPLFFVMENVPAALYRPELKRQLARLSDRFSVCAGVLNSACYGLPQTRQRTIVIGYRHDLGVRPTLPPPTHFGARPVFSYLRGRLVAPTVATLDEILGESPHIGVGRARRRAVGELLPPAPEVLSDLLNLSEAIGDLPVRREGSGREPSQPSDYAAALADGVSYPANHEAWGHTRETIVKLSAVPEGDRLRTARRYYSQAYARLHRRGLARTVTTNFHNAGCGRFTHWAEPRTLTVREAARLQGVADSFEFIGHRSTQERLVGNAFPPPWANAIAQHISGELSQALAFRRSVR